MHGKFPSGVKKCTVDVRPPGRGSHGATNLCPASCKAPLKKLLEGNGMFITAIPNCLNDTILSTDEWSNKICLLVHLEPLDMPQHYDGCGAKLTVDHVAT